jgi:hypothetical protein
VLRFRQVSDVNCKALLELVPVVPLTVLLLPALAWGCHAGDGPGTWQAADMDSSTPCPASANVQANQACSAPQGTSCKSEIPRLDCNGQQTGFVACTCAQGVWMCGAPSDCPEAGTDATASDEAGIDATASEGGEGSETGLDATSDATMDASAPCPSASDAQSDAACADGSLE